MDVIAVLNGDADFPVLGATREMCVELFEGYARRCAAAARIMDAYRDPDYDEELARQEAVSALVVPMKAISIAMMTLDTKMILEIMAEHFFNDENCLRFFEIQKANNRGLESFVDRVGKLQGKPS